MEQLKLDLDIWCGKTYSARSVQTTEMISASCWKKRQELRIKEPLFLDLRTGSGGLAGVSWETGGVLLGEYSTHSFGECPSVAVESRLSQILEENPHPKYYLSEKACRGVLRRAEKRGKELPPILKEALGILANERMKKGKRVCHEIFDKLWKNGRE